MTVPIVAAHPDDETLGCGATAAKLSKTEDVHVLFLGEGITARRAQSHDRDAVEQLLADARRATQRLGIKSAVFERLPDLRFDSVPLLDIVWKVERMIRSLRPRAILTHYPCDVNRDHQLTFHAVLCATRPVGEWIVPELVLFEVPGSCDWAFGRLSSPFSPNVFIDVTETIQVKIEAMETYQSERRPSPHPRSPEALKASAQRWGSVAGFEFAEAFELARSIRPYL